ncbi:hypothetical protein SO694_00002835 [Aureococcus anophagefferens]|uniref:Uncharacterized protein n=1 Tax=Aureococcus anophagefferens TaxID=44056 RepID=A0ABR1GCQ0_AURAN
MTEGPKEQTIGGFKIAYWRTGGPHGYDGEPARRIWRAIYEENCFDLDEAPSPKEQLVLAWRPAAS